jgi:nitroimidazol reductase NimA-like FMN-containing flavoprotein (pyridoxamine 5'-phosphate oxidase superfamily)
MTQSDHGRSEGAHADGSRSPDPGQELREIGEDECFSLLATQNLGRLAIVRDGRPEIFPVNYAMDGHTITIRTGSGVKLTYASLAHVAFEVEDIDLVTREGWVVEVRGFAEEITDTGDRWSEHARHAGVSPWVKGEHDHFLAISHVQVSGRRIGSPAAI